MTLIVLPEDRVFRQGILHKDLFNIFLVSLVKNSTKIDTLNGSDANYQYQWWIPNKDGDFIAEGILGQFIYVSPNDNLIIVRLGKKYGDVNWEGTFEKIKEILRTTK